MELTINIKEESKLDFFIQLITELNYVELIHPPLSYLNKIKNNTLKVEDSTAAYTIDGKSLNKEEYYNEILEAEKEIEDGNFITHNDLKKDIEEWHK